jgi:hypothetical protein
MKRYTVRAKRWEQGWELHIEGVGVTQVRSLARADQQVREYLETLFERRVGDVAIDVVPDLGGMEILVREARQRTRDAEEAQRTAADHARAVVRLLRDSGLSVDETAAVLGVSPGRVSQMAKATPRSAPTERRARAARQSTAARQTAAARQTPAAARALPAQPAAKLRKGTAGAGSRAVPGRSSSTTSGRSSSARSAATRSASTSRATAGRAARKAT